MSAPGSFQTPVILIGASNLTLGWHSLLRQLRAACQGPLDVHVVAGMGRSYIKPARFAHRSLPAILDCGLWNAVPATEAPPRVLITDVGNDLAYGFQPEQIMESVEACIARIRAWRAERAPACSPCHLLPPCNLSAQPVCAARTLLFPGSRLLLPDVLRLATSLADLLRSVALKNGIPTIAPPQHGTDWIRFTFAVHRERQRSPACLPRGGVNLQVFRRSRSQMVVCQHGRGSQHQPNDDFSAAREQLRSPYSVVRTFRFRPGKTQSTGAIEKLRWHIAPDSL
ncbi:MAG UNVERIFIED_CONTAM: SGNH/GDSL hydrolase family protein [Planctomycetaceae bacterium]|jgi:hypothetical protein